LIVFDKLIQQVLLEIGHVIASFGYLLRTTDGFIPACPYITIISYVDELSVS